MEKKERVKLYKAGKLWCTLTVTAIALTTGLMLTGVRANADSSTANPAEKTAQVVGGTTQKAPVATMTSEGTQPTDNTTIAASAAPAEY